MILRKVMWFELAYVLLIALIMLFGESQNMQVWSVEASDIYLLLLCVNMTLMVLHYALGAQEKFSDSDFHQGSPLTDKKAVIIIILLFSLLTIFAWIFIGFSMMDATKWSSLTNSGGFAFFHDMQSMKWINWLIETMCAVVQVCSIVDYWKHYSDNKHELSTTHSFQSENFDSGHMNKQHAKLSLINVCLALLGFCLIVIDMSLMSHYHHISSIFFNTYIVLVIFVQVPMLHFMIVR